MGVFAPQYWKGLRPSSWEDAGLVLAACIVFGILEGLI